MANTTKIRKRCLTANPTDNIWGLAISSVGRQSIAENEVYPPQEHSMRYLFNTQKGRILNEYQLLYITKGKGVFSSKNSGIWHFFTVFKKATGMTPTTYRKYTQGDTIAIVHQDSDK